MEMKEQLIEETKKWLEKIKAERENIALADSGRADFLENIDAYISDSEFFLEHEEHIEAFEAVIWAWSYLTIGKDLGFLAEKEVRS